MEMDSTFVKYAIKFQAFKYFPTLLLTRISWLNESFKTADGLGAVSDNSKLELEKRTTSCKFTKFVSTKFCLCIQ